MKARVFVHIIIALALLAIMPSCQSGTQVSTGGSRGSLEQQLAESRALVRRYENRYGKLPAGRPKHDFRKLRADLKGKPAGAVTAVLGKPVRVFSSGTRESWDYENVAYDPVSGRTVRNLEIWFSKGLVDYMNASF